MDEQRVRLVEQVPALEALVDGGAESREVEYRRNVEIAGAYALDELVAPRLEQRDPDGRDSSKAAACGGVAPAA